jgi:hypothetical protein
MTRLRPRAPCSDTRSLRTGWNCADPSALSGSGSPTAAKSLVSCHPRLRIVSRIGIGRQTSMASCSTAPSSRVIRPMPRTGASGRAGEETNWAHATDRHRRPWLRRSQSRPATHRPRRQERGDPPQRRTLTGPTSRRTPESIPPHRQWRTCSEGRISYLKRGYDWDRIRIDGTEGARIWTVVASESWCKSTGRFTTSPSAYGLRSSGDRPARSCR